MTTVQPRRTAHRGSVLASGLAIDTRLIPEQEARGRLLQLSPLGIDGFRVGPFLILRFREAVRFDCAGSVGAPLVRYGWLLSSAPLDRDERTILEPFGEAVVLAAGGFASATRLDDEVREDISVWVDASEFLIVDNLRPLGGVISEPRAQFMAVAADVRLPLGVAALKQEAVEIVQSLIRRGSEGSAQAGAAPVGLSWLGRAMGGLSQFIVAALRRRTKVGRAGSSQSRALAVVPSPEIKNGSWLSRTRAAFKHFAARALLSSKLGRLVGRRHAEYLGRMLEMFDENDLDNALRHAIPLSAELESALRPAALSVPFARTDLSIVPNRGPAATSLSLGGDLFEELRQRYRRAFERLTARGDIEKAAFVLAELLNANEEAVSFLERHGRLRLAAEVAEARHLPPGLVIRQWFLAGDRGRAIAVARRTGAFADAVVRLESSHKDEGRALRLLWADSLASGGAYAAAVDAVWPIETARNLALAWLERAIEIGGPTGARMLARKVRLLPGKFSDLRNQSLKLLRDEGEDFLAVGQAFGQELLTGEMTDETRVLAKAAARTLLRSAEDKEVDRLVHRLLDASGDAVFRADVRASVSQNRRVRPRGRIHVRAFACTDKGKKRSKNEDACIATLLNAPGSPQKNMHVDGDAAAKGVVLGVFDGDSGWEDDPAGDVASSMAAQIVADWLRSEFAASGSDPGQWARCLAVSLEQASQKIFQDAAATHRGMTCGATVASFSGSTLFLGQVGRTRGYVLRGEKLVQVTRDHSLLNDYLASSVAQGKTLTQKEMEEFPHQHVITRSLGTAEQVSVDLSRVELQEGDVILLCTGGLSSIVNDEAIRKTLLERPNPQVACNALLAMARKAGAPDNIGIVVARVEGKGLRSSQPSPLVFQLFEPPTIDGREVHGPAPLRSMTKPVEVRRLAGDKGAISILDAAELPDGRMLVALGELGVWLISRDGKVIARFSEPTSRIVISDLGDRAILLAPRGETFRVSRLDLISKRVQPWCDARFDQFASDFDGSTWFVSRGDTLYAIDAISARWEQLWKVDERGTSVSSIRRDDKTASAWFARPGPSSEVWTFELPSLTLRHRKVIEKDEVPFLVGAISPSGTFVGWQGQPEQSTSARIHLHGAWKTLPIATASLPEAPYVTDSWIVVRVVEQEGTMIHVIDSPGLQERARIGLEGSLRNVGVRIQGERLVVFDGCGRVAVLSLKTGAVMREHRVA